MDEQRPFLAAVVDPEVAFYWAMELGPVFDRAAARRSDRLRRKMLHARAQLQEAGRQWVEARLPGTEPAEVVEPVETMTVREAAVSLAVTEQYVRRLCQRGVDDGGLAASRHARVWVIEAWSVRAHRAQRSHPESA